jgi:CMP-N-acetylneuraminic acid synthetase/spore coat polysaccharide biosynthesis predicted glycosyltransferase SpsG
MNAKIVAVIPARAGSKGIPNKNIRLINGKPLIYYAINNALNSAYINNVIVSTDSQEVITIAKQMGVQYKKRSDDLCTDSATLDAVIFDAIENVEADYIVTMQPTSPTLKTETLDSAIKFCIINDLDTVISVINSPHLSWTEIDGKKVPNYKQRLNRQFLPPHYIETGAFLISRSNVVTKYTRIGTKTDVYEVSREESIDIDTYADLKYAESILLSKKVGFYVNGNNTRGVGHIYRALELADEFSSKPDIYYDLNQTDVRAFGKTMHNLIALDGIADLFNTLENSRYDLFINDVLDTSVDYMIALRKSLPGAKIVNFEDDGEGVYSADLVINALYNSSRIHNMKVGKEYYISAKNFMFFDPINIREKVETVFISFGGADPQNYSDRLLEIITKEKYEKFKFIVVLGRAKNNITKLMEYNSYKNITVLYDIQNMPEIMSKCDIGLTSRGRTGYELAMLGVPTIAMAQNTREEKHGFISHENGFNYLGLHPSDHVIEANLELYLELEREERQRYQNMLLNHNLRGGRNRVMSLINSL